MIFDSIRQIDAAVELIDGGAAQGVWDAEKGFCAYGAWSLEKIQSWTIPAADSRGVIVTHIKVLEKFAVSWLGRAVQGVNPMGLTLTLDGTFKAAKYNDGWQLAGEE